MPRTLAALILGAAVIAAAMSPVAAGADPAPFFFKRHQERLHLACTAVRDADQPAVACKWELKSRPKPAPDPAPVAYRLWRARGGESRKVVFEGSDQSFVDTDVKPGTTYWYRAEALDSADQSVTLASPQRRSPRTSRRTRRSSSPSRVLGPAERPVEHLSLACEPVKDAAGQANVACIVAVDKNRRLLAQSPAAQPQAVRSQQKTTSH